MARRKEHDEEMKTARSLVAKMEYEVVEMVMKLWRLMGHLGGEEEEEDDGGGGVVVEMEEEMEENEVEDLVKEWWRRWWWKWRSSGRPREWAAVGLSIGCKKKKRNERGRRREWLYNGRSII